MTELEPVASANELPTSWLAKSKSEEQKRRAKAKSKSEEQKRRAKAKSKSEEQKRRAKADPSPPFAKSGATGFGMTTKKREGVLLRMGNASRQPTQMRHRSFLCQGKP